MRMWMSVLIPLLLGCGGSDQPAERTDAAIADGSCLRVALRVAEGFEVDGQPTPTNQVGSALARALEAGNRTAVVDLTCGEAVTMREIRTLHEMMLEQDLHRIQYFQGSGPPIPYVLPDTDMDVRLDALPERHRCEITIDPDGTVNMAGETFDRESVTERLASDPGVVFVLRAADAVPYENYVRVLADLTGAGAQRLSVRLGDG